MMENLERSRSETIRLGNVWVDVQQVFYRMEENVPSCHAQKPLKAIQRIVDSSSNEGDLIVDFLSHSGTVLIAGESSRRRVYTLDSDPNVRGEPDFTVTYTEIPKTLRGYDKEGRWSDDGEPRKKPVRNHTPRQCVG